MDPSEHAEQAARLLKHYMAMLFEKNGLVWNSDNNTEMDDIVFHLIEAAR